MKTAQIIKTTSPAECRGQSYELMKLAVMLGPKKSAYTRPPNKEVVNTNMTLDYLDIGRYPSFHTGSLFS